MKNVIIVVILIAIIAGGAFYFMKKSNSSHQEMTMPSSGKTTSQTQPAPSSKNIVKYTEDGFSPKTITIKKGDTVTWMNEDSDPMWVASDPHPVHTNYPTKGGCIGSTFDLCKGINKGQIWSFKFDFVGEWGYHNHLTPTNKGTIIVQ